MDDGWLKGKRDLIKNTHCINIPSLIKHTVFTLSSQLDKAEDYFTMYIWILKAQRNEVVEMFANAMLW